MESDLIRQRLILIALVCLWPLIAAAVSLEQIPDAYGTGRADAKYGIYNSVLSDAARPLQDKLLQIESKVFGLSLVSAEDPVYQSELVLELETQILTLHLQIANAALDDFARNSLLFNSIHIYASMRHHAERLYESMIRFIDVKIPGPSGLQIRHDLGAEVSLYLPNYRSDTPLSVEEQQKFYREKLNSFLARGGSLNEIKTLGPEVYKSMGPITRMEYVVVEAQSPEQAPVIRVTEGKAGHLLLAEGGPVLASGQLLFLKNKTGEFTLLVVSNSSGNFKPDLYSVGPIANRIRSEIDLAEQNVVLTKGEPLSTQTYAVFLKGQGASRDQIQTAVAQLEARISAAFVQFLPSQKRPNCEDLLAKAL